MVDSIRKNVIPTLITMMAFLLGEADKMLITLLMFIVLDYLSGVMSGFITGTLSSKVGFKGIVKKVFILILIATATHIDMVLNAGGSVRFIYLSVMIGNEGISILENAGQCGVPGTDFLYAKLSQLRDSGNDGEGKE